nr:MAG TPA: hypothetical protein [Caudoviricetes sp.]
MPSGATQAPIYWQPSEPAGNKPRSLRATQPRGYRHTPRRL